MIPDERPTETLLVCPDCKDGARLNQEAEVWAPVERTWKCRIQDGALVVEVGCVDGDLESAVDDAFCGVDLTCACGWLGPEDDLVQIGWDGRPVEKQIAGQVSLLEAA